MLNSGASQSEQRPSRIIILHCKIIEHMIFNVYIREDLSRKTFETFILMWSSSLNLQHPWNHIFLHYYYLIGDFWNSLRCAGMFTVTLSVFFHQQVCRCPRKGGLVKCAFVDSEPFVLLTQKEHRDRDIYLGHCYVFITRWHKCCYCSFKVTCWHFQQTLPALIEC